MAEFSKPDGYERIQIVNTFEEFIATPMADGVNALCWPRELPGDFEEIVHKLPMVPGITSIDVEELNGLTLSTAGSVARRGLLEDQELLRQHNLAPSLDCIRGYPHEEFPAIFPTHVQSFHVDSATAAVDTLLCTYFGASSEGLRNEQALCRIDIPEVRFELLRLYGGPDDAGFRDYLSENFHDLHYVPLPHAKPFSFGLHNLWRIACDYPGSPVPPCIHRAPDTIPGAPPRLLLIS